MMAAPQAVGLVALAERIELWPIDEAAPVRAQPAHAQRGAGAIRSRPRWSSSAGPTRSWSTSSGGILAGHGRLLAARKLGLGRGAGDPVRASQRGAEAGLPDRRQPARPAGGLGRGAAGGGAGVAAGRALRPRPGRLRCHRAGAAAGARRWRGGERRGRGRGPGAARGPGQQAGRPLGAGQPPPAVRRRHGAGRRRAGARRRSSPT